MMRIHNVTRGTRRRMWGVGVATAALLLAPLSIARAGIIQPELSVVGGTGLPGGTVSVTLNLSDDVDDAAVSVGVFLRFDDSVLNFSLPVAGSCTLADRIQGTHQVAGNILEPGLVDIEVLVSGSPSPVPPLGNGEIVTCDFGIEPGVPAGTSAIEIESPLLGDAEGDPIPVRTQDGQVEIILEPPTATPTATGTPENTPTATPTLPATATVTDTPVTPPSATPSVTPTNTTSPVTPPTSTATATVTKTITPPTIAATSTPTATNTTPPTPTRTGNTPTPTRKSAGGDDGCNIVPNGHSEANGMLALLLAPALLLWVRRRS